MSREVAVAARLRELAHGAVVSHEPGYEGELVLAAQPSGVAAAGVADALELDARQRMDERGESGHVLDARLAVHHPDLDGAVARLQAHVPPRNKGSAIRPDRRSRPTLATQAA